MKVLTVKQPWAHLICSGIKDIENRTWKTNYRGRVLIHASADKKLNLKALTKEQYAEACELFTAKNKIPIKSVDRWERSAIIGSVEIVDCVINHPSVWAEKGCYNWVLANPILFDKPVLNIKGKLSIWNLYEYDEIVCPECGQIQLGQIEDTIPFPTFIHNCHKCGYIIMESEWEAVK